MPNADGSATEEEAQAAELDALERSVAGAEHRLLELQGMAAAHPDMIEAAQADVEGARKLLLAAAKPKKAASKRPAKAAEER